MQRYTTNSWKKSVDLMNADTLFFLFNRLIDKGKQILLVVNIVVDRKDPLNHLEVSLDTGDESLTPSRHKGPVIIVEFDAENGFQFHIKQKKPVTKNASAPHHNEIIIINQLTYSEISTRAYNHTDQCWPRSQHLKKEL